MSEEQNSESEIWKGTESDTQSSIKKETNSQGLEPEEPLTENITDEDLDREIKILEEQIPKSDDDKFRKKPKKDEIFEQGADNVSEVSEEELEKDYGL